MEQNKHNRRSSSNRENENWNRTERNDYDQPNYGFENTRRDYRQSDQFYGPDNNSRDRGLGYGDDFSQDRYSSSRNSYDQNRWPQDNDRHSNRQYNEFNRYQDYDRGFDNIGGYGSDRSERNSGNRGRGSGNNYGDMQQGNWNNNRNNQDRNWWDRSRDEVSSWFGDDDAERRRNMDHQGDMSHRGKGPKDYQRSESRIREDVSDKLSDDHHIDASDIEVKVSGSEVTLSGTVESRQAKRHAEDIAESVSGVSNVVNQLKLSQSTNKSNGSSSKDSSKDKTSTGNSLKTEKMHHN